MDGVETRDGSGGVVNFFSLPGQDLDELVKNKAKTEDLLRLKSF